ncbi:MAG: SagB family peptide dehydrogenase [Proteobacteria bacterium]|nr:SagB family peptide dehydrogenase [Pseudomonadota bacterium]
MTVLRSAAEYHRLTRYAPNRISGGGMDPLNQPNPYKTYPGAERIDLPRDVTLPKAPAWGILKGDLKRTSQPLDLPALARLLYMACGFTAQVQHGLETFYYRSAPSAGALYPVEVYLAARDVPGLEDGLYHFTPADFALTRLRRERPPAEIPAPCLFLSALFFRSAWKYRQRAFRYCLMDAGHMAENLHLASSALGLEAEVDLFFLDDPINDYLGLDTDREACLAMVGLGGKAEGTGRPGPAGGTPTAEPTAPNEEIFDLVSAAVRVTAAPSAGPPEKNLPWPAGRPRVLAEPDWEGFDGPTLVRALRERRSRRNFVPQEVTQDNLARFLDLVSGPELAGTVNLGLVTNEVRDLPDGFHHWLPSTRTLDLRTGGFIGPLLADTALNQDWMGRANLILAVSTPLDFLEAQCGPRALRLAYLAAGRVGHRAYLGAETLGWGCCGVGAFFDEKAGRVLGLPPSEDLLYLLPVGPYRKRTHGGRPASA